MPPGKKKNRPVKLNLFDRILKKQEVAEQKLDCADTDVVDDAQIKTEVLDVEETMDISAPDITVETHESVEELRRVLNLPNTQINKESLTIKSEEPWFNDTSLQNGSLGFSNTEQSAADSSNCEQITATEEIIIGMPKLSDETFYSENVDHHNVRAIRWEHNRKYPIIDLSVLNNTQSEVSNKVCRIEEVHPLAQACDTSIPSPISNPTLNASGSQTISGFSKGQYSEMIKEGLREKIRRRHHSVMKKKIGDRKELTLNVPYFKSIKYDPDLNFLLSLMPFLKSLSPSLRSKARAQIKEMILEPRQSSIQNKTSETFIAE